MTDHFFGGEGGEKEAGHQFSVIAESSPASFSLPSQNQQHTVIATTRNEVGSNLKGTKDIIKGK
ncbi:MAG: hypothetical protein NTZ69_09755 [Bacteroidia bacterium]|nr:hypothetical protein [Bacteroidia bacterium]